MRSTWTRLRAFVGVAMVSLVACAGGGHDGGGTGGGGGGCKCEAPGCPTVSLAQNIQPIFNRSCAQSAACHAGGAPVQDLNLQAGQSRSQTVGVKATETRGEIRVKPGNPDDSFLVKKIEYPAGTPGDQMPVGCEIDAPTQGAVCPRPDEILAIRQWITECALDN